MTAKEAKLVQDVLKDAIYLIGEGKHTAAHLLLGAEFRRLEVLTGEE